MARGRPPKPVPLNPIDMNPPKKFHYEKTIAQWVENRRDDQHILFSEPEKKAICKMIGEFRTAREIKEAIKRDFGKILTHSNLISNYSSSPKWRPLIEKYRQEYAQVVSNIPIFHEKVRLERLENLYQETHDDKSVGTEWRKNSQKREQLTGLLHEARDETTRSKEVFGNTTNILSIQLNNLTDEELLKKREEVLQRINALRFTPGTTEEVSNGGSPELQDSPEVA